MSKVKITVYKTLLFEELLCELDMEYKNGENRDFGKCPRFNEGDTFFIDNIDDIPNKFCSWAWCDIERDVAMILFGAEPEPKLKKSHSMYSCCDEGIRPVIFYIERIDNESKE